jgi:hypothetical protein
MGRYTDRDLESGIGETAGCIGIAETDVRVKE